MNNETSFHILGWAYNNPRYAEVKLLIRQIMEWGGKQISLSLRMLSVKCIWKQNRYVILMQKCPFLQATC